MTDLETHEDKIYFTIEEANALLPYIAERFTVIEQHRNVIRDLIQQGADESNTDIQNAIQAINDELREIHATGCLVKDLDTGLIDFYAHGEDGDIFLCWKKGEAEIGFWHPLDTGIAGRQPISTLIGSQLRPLH